MRIAYLIIAHDQPLHFQRLVKALDSTSAYFFVHVDLKSNISQFQFSEKMDNVTFLKDRVSVNHGGYSLTRAMLNLLTIASEKNFDYFIFLSGRDYPIKSNDYIVQFLNKNYGMNFINFYPLIEDAHLVHHIKKYHFVDLRKNYKLLKPLFYLLNKCMPERKFIHGITPYRGSQWFCLNKATVDFVVQFSNSVKNKSFKNFFKYVWGSDEIFFQTIVLNSEYASQCRCHETGFKDSNKVMKNENTAYLHYIDWSFQRENPAILNENDFQRLKETDALFARKFDERYSCRLLEDIDKFLLSSNP